MMSLKAHLVVASVSAVLFTFVGSASACGEEKGDKKDESVRTQLCGEEKGDKKDES